MHVVCGGQCSSSPVGFRSIMLVATSVFARWHPAVATACPRNIIAHSADALSSSCLHSILTLLR